MGSSGAGTRDEPLRTSAWEAINKWARENQKSGINLIPLTIFKSFIWLYFMNHTFCFVTQHPLFNLHTS